MSNIQQAIDRAAKAKTAKKASAPNAEAVKKGAREGRVLIGGHFDVSVRKRLLAIRAKQPDLTTQALLEEALDLLFERYGQPRLR